MDAHDAADSQEERREAKQPLLRCQRQTRVDSKRRARRLLHHAYSVTTCIEVRTRAYRSAARDPPSSDAISALPKRNTEMD